MKLSNDPLRIFHPYLRRWFGEKYGTPTEVQSKAWTEIAAGRHALITAPTGSGKTLAAFLWALDRLLTGVWHSGHLQVLYVSPLKALNNDVQRNLLTPLTELRTLFEACGEETPSIRVLTRSGDTPGAERQRMLRHPPEILITTPESLNLMLSSRKATRLFATVRAVILDEVHAVAETKRGAHLMTAIERLVPMAGEFQRVALSATVKPLDTMRHFIGGYSMNMVDGEPHYRRRPVSLVRSQAPKKFELVVRAGGRACRASSAPDPIWRTLASTCRAIIDANRATLIFTNSRRLCERLCLFINEEAGCTIAYSHHGSLSRETRLEVERRLKQGELAAIVATSSLELGIDIGHLDQVILVQTPPSVSSTIQRLGRAGHGVGEVSRGTLFPIFGRDYLDAAVSAASVLEQDIEPFVPIQAPLDVLAQVIVSMTGTDTWNVDALYHSLRASYPFHALSRVHFDLVLDMLAGRYAESRLRALEPLVIVDRVDDTVRARDHALRCLYTSGGTIPDRGYFDLRRNDTKAKIGELDEEFVWERSPGDAFTLGAQSWQIVQVTHNDVLVEPARTRQAFIPFWRAEDVGRGFHLSQRVGEFLEWAGQHLSHLEYREALHERYCLDAGAVEELLEFLNRQVQSTGPELPHRHHLVVEHVSSIDANEGVTGTVLHTFWGSPLNRPYALALSQAWENRYGCKLDVLWNADGILLATPRAIGASEMLGLVTPANLEALLRRKLETTGFFGARFRENAARALLLPKLGFQRRTPLWMSRLRSKQLLEAVNKYPDFPIVLETWRTCLQDEFDLKHLRMMLDELATGAVCVTETSTPSPSPFAEGLAWQQTNRLMYEDDTPLSGRTSNLTTELLRELMFSPEVRPRLPHSVIEAFENKAQRLTRGYAPSAVDELVDWVEERLFVPLEEWRHLLEAVADASEIPGVDLIREAEHKLVRVVAEPGHEGGVVAVAGLPRLRRAFRMNAAWRLENLAGNPVELPRVPLGQGEEDSDGALATWLVEWLRYYGPIPVQEMVSKLPFPADLIEATLKDLSSVQTVVLGELSADCEGIEVCETENYEVLLRMARTERRSDAVALPLLHLPLFLAHWQGLTERGTGLEALQGAMDRLFGCPVAVERLEEEILPARVLDYKPGLLDELAQESGLMWIGCGERTVALAFDDHLDLFLAPGDHEDILSIFPSLRGRYTFDDLLKITGMDSARLSKTLWHAAWRGQINNDTFLSLRRGIEHKFKSAELSSHAVSGRRAGFQRWKATRPLAGHWQVLHAGDVSTDPLERDEANKERVRVLLDRYGVLFRELLREELPELRWAVLFRTLRLMELSGEIVSGYFFEDVPGLQFATPRAARVIQEPLPETKVFWVCADDPASLCGVDLPDLKEFLPRRHPNTHMVFEGARLVLVSKRLGKDIQFMTSPEAPRLEEYLEVFHHLLNRAVRPVSYVTIETINGQPAHASAYLEAFRRHFDVDIGRRGVTFWKRHG